MALLLAVAACQSRAEPLPVITNEPLREISRDIFQLGAVRLDKNRRTVQFPAQVNMKEGVVEYFLVNTRGKSYESLLRTDIEPYYIHLAMLLIGAKGAPSNTALNDAPSQPFHINRPANATNLPPHLAIQGDPVTIELAWETPSGRKQVRAEDCIINLATKTNAARGAWTYNGSRVIDGVFIAQREGSVVAMIDDVDAMANNPRPGSDDDQIWQINSNALPSTNTTVQVTFKLEQTSNK
jgi:hypothetical protein